MPEAPPCHGPTGTAAGRCHSPAPPRPCAVGVFSAPPAARAAGGRSRQPCHGCPGSGRPDSRPTPPAVPGGPRGSARTHAPAAGVPPPSLTTAPPPRRAAAPRTVTVSSPLCVGGCPACAGDGSPSRRRNGSASSRPRRSGPSAGPVRPGARHRAPRAGRPCRRRPLPGRVATRVRPHPEALPAGRPRRGLLLTGRPGRGAAPARPRIRGPLRDIAVPCRAPSSAPLSAGGHRTHRAQQHPGSSRRPPAGRRTASSPKG